MSVKSRDPTSLHNPYFYQKPGQKDIWSLINETAAQAQEELGKPIVNLGQGFFHIILLILLLMQLIKHYQNHNLINMLQLEEIQIY